MDEARLTRRRLLEGIGLGTVAAGLAACGSSESPAAKSTTGPGTPAPGSPGASAVTSSGTPSATPTAKPTSKPTTTDAELRRKIASLLVVGFRGEHVGSSDWIMKAISTQGLGGVILFDRDQQSGGRRNISSPKQVTALIHSLQTAAPGKLIVSVDQEGGQIARLNPGDGFPVTASEAEIGAANSPAKTKAWAEGIARTLTSVGFNFNFAPVVDLNVNPRNPAIGALGRSFSANPDVVVANATEEIRAHRAAGVRTVLKHFPGFGSATGNTDFGVVDVSKTWKRVELEPFAKLIAAGDADSVMAAHLLNSQLDPTRPASLSSKVVGGLLRDQLGWKGAVVSDDMQAVAITSKYGRAEAVSLAVEAGVDMLVFANQEVYDTAVVSQTVDTIVGLVHSGRVTEAQIDKSVARVDALRPAN